MFLLFTFSFGTDFYIAAGVLLGIEFLGLFCKLIDFSFLYKYFIEDDLIDDTQVKAEVEQTYDGAMTMLKNDPNNMMLNKNVISDRRMSLSRRQGIKLNLDNLMNFEQLDADAKTMAAAKLAEVGQKQLEDQQDRLLSKMDLCMRSEKTELSFEDASGEK